MNKYGYFYILLSICFLSFGCSSRHSGWSWVGQLPEDSAIASIADDATSQILEVYAPGHSSVFILTPKERNNFSQVFEDSLRSKGFSIVTSETSDSLKVAYILDKIKSDYNDTQDSWYLQLKLISTKAGTNIYSSSYTADGLSEGSKTLTTINNQSVWSRIKNKTSNEIDNIGIKP